MASSSSAHLNLPTEKMGRVAFVLNTTAHPPRIAIVQLLVSQESMSVNDISEKLGVEQSLLSHHLAGMKLEGILSSHHDGKSMLYSLKMREVVDVIQCLTSCTFL
ncbi:metalloregulator ArsR/SmtB family transcription factor [Hymenobacter tibetensis]|uniref:Metalloregulator ArsR/SmtB family transcription factor n=1 Tax=Hymenobacter tibetensis TaxID=497967 RepID=A0ABY4D1J7_9BACT|nr:metalloregulator ArsR/SmtB family transcription factor [Hymenobacter tibetensis]UOG76398.1 metalloregulator ArsR/SmtB family transcription factor [Hymenobacter tibetensis]